MLQTARSLDLALLNLRQRLTLLSPPQRLTALHLINQVRELHDNEPLRFFEPNPAQQRYIDAVGLPEGFIVLFSAGNGVGKTAATVAIMAAIIWPEMAPACFSSWIYQNWPYPKHFRIISTPQEISGGGSIQNEIAKWFPRGQYEALKNGKTYNSQYLAKDFTINLMSYDMAPEAFEGATCGLIAFNEPPPKNIFNACGARMRKGGRMLFPGTPLMDAAWIMDDLVSKAQHPYIQLVPGDIEQNCREHSVNGQLAHADIERMIKNYDPDEMEARIHGKFMHLAGRIYKTFDRSVHVTQEVKIPEVCSFYQAVDPALGKPFSVVYGFAEPGGAVTIFDEWPSFEFEGAKDDGKTVKDYADLFRSIEAQHGIKSITRILDRHFGNKRQVLGKDAITLRQEFNQNGIEFCDSYTMDEEVETGIRKVKEYLAYDKTKSLSALNRPKVTIAAKCTNTIASFEKWGRNPDTRKPAEEFKDFSDSTRYLLMSNPHWEQPIVWGPRKQPHYGVHG